MSRTGWIAAFMTAVVVGLVIGAWPRGSSSNHESSFQAERVLVIAIPGLTWNEVRQTPVPHLDALFARSLVADMTVRGANDHPSVADGYVTMSTGARAESPARAHDGECNPVNASVVCSGADSITRHNDKLLYDASYGLLGDRVAAAGYSRAVVSDAASSSAPLALADRKGVVASGALAPRDVVTEAGHWFTDGSVVLVELHPGPMLDAQIAGLTALAGGSRDAIVVVAPSQPPGHLQTTVAALSRPGLTPGLMRSAYTRRSGTVALVDVAPTVLDLVGAPRPAEMEGRPFEAGRAGGTPADRVRWLASTNTRAHFRDAAISEVDGIFIAAEFALAVLAGSYFAFAKRRPWMRGGLEVFALMCLFFLPTTYLAMLSPFATSGLPGYWLVVVIVSAAAAAVTYATTRRRSTLGVEIALAAVVALIVVDVCTGARLQFNGPFGYSPTIGGRYAGLGNLGYAQLAGGVALFTGLFVSRVPTRGARVAAIALAVLAIVVDGAPFLGADVGGVLSLVPSFGIMGAMYLGWRFRWRLVLWFGAAAVAVVGVFAVIDLSRPAGSRSHLGRVLGGGGGDLTVVLRRKIAENLSILSSNPFAFLLPVAFLVAAYVVYRSPGPLRIARDRLKALDAALIGFGFVALLGTALNDSGVAITGVLFGVLVPVLVFACTRTADIADGADVSP